MQGCSLDPVVGVLWVTLPMGASASSYVVSLVGLDTASGSVLHRLDVFTPLSGPAAFSFDAHRGKVIGLWFSMDEATHAINGSDFFEIDSRAGVMSMVTLRSEVLPPSVVEVLGAVAAVDAVGRVFYFECIVANNATRAVVQQPRLASRSVATVDGEAAWRGAMLRAFGSGTATRRGIEGGQPTRIQVGARGRERGAATLTGLCALDASSGRFKFSSGVCTDMSACPWNLQFWN